MVYFNRRLARHIDIPLVIIILTLVGVGLIAIASATHFVGPSGLNVNFIKIQVVAAILGMLFVGAILLFDYRWLKDYANLIYLGTLGILVVTLIMASTVSGAKSWFRLGPVNFQPTELAKLAIIVVLAAFIADREEEMKYLSGMLKAACVVGLPALMVLAQNDLGSALVFIGILCGMLFVGGGNAKLMASVLSIGIILILTLVLFSMHYDLHLPFLKSYQLKRLQVLINPYIDPYGHGYNIIQAKIAIGSGQLLGKGLFKGTQNQLRFLPEKHTDFIYCVVGEEFGFIGGFFVLCLYLGLLLRCVYTALEARDSFGTLVVVGIISMWLFHILENVGMVLGIMPVTGIPLPFISYGGSSMLTNLIAVGIVLNIRMRRQKILF